MRCQTLTLGNEHDIVLGLAQGILGIIDVARTLDEACHAQGGEESCRAGSGQDVIGTCIVIPERLGGIGTEEHGAGIVECADELQGIFHHDLKVLGGDGIGKLDGLCLIAGDEHRTVIFHSFPDDVTALEVFHLAQDLCLDLVGECRIGGHEDGRGKLIMLCLAHEVRCDELRVRRFIGEHQDLTGACDHVDVHNAVEQLLGGGDKDVAGADDLVHLRDLLGPVGKRCNGLCAAGEEDPVHAADSSGNEDILVRGAVLAGGRDHDDLPHPSDLGRDGIHQHARRIGCRAAGNVQSHPGKAAHTLAEDHAVRLCIGKALGLLPVVEGGDVLLCIQKCIDKFRIRRRQCIVDDLAGDLVVLRQIAVEFLRVGLDGLVAALTDGADDLGDDLRHLAVRFAAAALKFF